MSSADRRRASELIGQMPPRLAVEMRRRHRDPRSRSRRSRSPACGETAGSEIGQPTTTTRPRRRGRSPATPTPRRRGDRRVGGDAARGRRRRARPATSRSRAWPRTDRRWCGSADRDDARLFNASLPCGAELVGPRARATSSSPPSGSPSAPGPGTCGDGDGARGADGVRDRGRQDRRVAPRRRSAAPRRRAARSSDRLTRRRPGRRRVADPDRNGSEGPRRPAQI